MDRRRRETFDEIAELYDKVRPGYAEGLIEDVITLSRLPPGGRILEIGCGPGKATLPFARRGYAMVCIELGERMAALAARNCRLYPAVQIVHATFEDWSLEHQGFDLVMSAQAFHWIAPQVGFPRAAAALRDGGALALFWNHQRIADPAFLELLESVYQQRAPELAGTEMPRPLDELERETLAEIAASGFFGPVTVRHYPWTAHQPTDRYADGVSTSSYVRALDAARRHCLLAGITEAVQAYGGEVKLSCVATLYVARLSRGSAAGEKDGSAGAGLP